MDLIKAQNPIATLLRTIALIEFIAGVIVFIFFTAEFDIVYALYPLIGGIILGAMFLGFAEIIELLTKIHDKNNQLLSIVIREVGRYREKEQDKN